MSNNLGNSDLVVQLKKSLHVEEINGDLRFLLVCCNIYTKATNFMVNWSDPPLNFERPSKATIGSMVIGLSKPFDHNGPFELESDNETAEVEIDLQLYICVAKLINFNQSLNGKYYIHLST
jgi:hypothetical protein